MATCHEKVMNHFVLKTLKLPPFRIYGHEQINACLKWYLTQSLIMGK
jgi:hypothetical protein